jgi:Putative Ig domain
MRLRLLGLILAVLLLGFAGGCGVTTSPSIAVVLTVNSALPSGTVNVPYSATLSATGGLAPYTWSLTGGSLPTGLSLSSKGVLSGMPTAAGSSTATILVTDSGGIPGKGILTATIVISAGAVVITTASPLAAGALNVAYSATLAASGGTSPYTWSLAGGSLPAGVTLSAAGVISGTPTAYGISSFSVQATDSSSAPQSATAPLVLEISGGTLSITTASLPSGTEGVAYSEQLSASGGIPPYTWSISDAVPIAAGLEFSAAGLLAGMPTGISNTTPIFTVVDSGGTAASQALNLLVQPAPASIPDGSYAFIFGGTSPQGTPTISNGIAINGTFTVKSGAVLSGFFDVNTNTVPALIEQPISGGTFTAYANGLGTLVLQSGTGNMTFALAIPPSATQGKDTAIRIIEFDDADGTGTRGSGVLKPATANPAAAAIQGNFAFLLSGSDVNQNEQALMGAFGTDGNGTITGGLADANQAGALQSLTIAPGTTYAVDANGRGTFGFSFFNVVYHFSFYQISPGEWLAISIDPANDNSPLVSGSVLQQQPGGFSNASLDGTSVLEMNGLAPEAATRVPDITLGLATADGNGNMTVSFDEYNGTLNSNQSAAYTYAVDPVTGRTTTLSTSGAGPKFYLIDSTRAFALGFDVSASSGMLELQSGSPFTNGSFSGSYLGGSLALISPSVLNEAGIVAADGEGNILLTTNRSSPDGLVPYQNVAGTYAVDGSGRVVATTPDGVMRIFYIVSPTKVAYLTSDGGGYLGSFAQ